MNNFRKSAILLSFFCKRMCHISKNSKTGMMTKKTQANPGAMIKHIIKAKINADFITAFRDKLKSILEEGEGERYDL